MEAQKANDKPAARAVNVHHSNGLMNVIDLAEQMSAPVDAEDKATENSVAPEEASGIIYGDGVDFPL